MPSYPSSLLCLGKELPIDNVENVHLGVRGGEVGEMGLEEGNRTAFLQMGLAGYTWIIFVNFL